jgi:hypothetical protein
MSVAISSFLHSRDPEFDLYQKEIINKENLNEFLEKFSFNKLSVSQAYYSNNNKN